MLLVTWSWNFVIIIIIVISLLTVNEIILDTCKKTKKTKILSKT